MLSENLVRALKGSRPWLFPLICLAVILGGCGDHKPPISKQAQTLKKELLGEMQALSAALAEPVANQDWETVSKILQTSHAALDKKGKPAPNRIAVLDRHGILQVRHPQKREEHFDFYQFEPVKIVYLKKKRAQARLYAGKDKIFIVIAPLLEKTQVAGAVVLALSAEDLKNTWKVSEQEFLNIDFNS